MLHLAALTFLLALSVTAHPGEDHHAEALERRAALDLMGKRSLSHCNSRLSARGVHNRNEIRRRAIYEQLTQRVQLEQRDIASVLNTSHHSNITGVTPETNSSTFFSGENQCILAPDVTEGPYYVTGEQFRKNMTESQAGVPIYLDVQVIDTNTCEPLPNIALDLWHCNATGVYSGVVANGNGEISDTSNINATFLRGIQITDSDGVLQSISIVPGHYTGRTTHIHIMAHTEGNYELLPNKTITGGTQAAHVGQLYFDQDLIYQVEKLAPYTENTQILTLNSEDDIMAEGAEGADPVVEYVLLGDSVEQGVFAWISIGINSTANFTVHAAVHVGEGGGVVNDDSAGGQSGGSPSSAVAAADHASTTTDSGSPVQASIVPFLTATLLLIAVMPFTGLV